MEDNKKTHRAIDPGSWIWKCDGHLATGIICLWVYEFLMLVNKK